MPFTPFHFGFGVFVFALCPFVDLPAILVGTVIIDIEGILYLLFKIGREHGYTHSLLGVMIYLIPTTFISWVIYKIYQRITKKEFRFNWILSGISSLLGLISHVIFDGSLYPEMMIFYPFSQVRGHIYGIMSYQTIIVMLTMMFGVGAMIVMVKSILRVKLGRNLLISYNLFLPIELEKFVQNDTYPDSKI